MVPGTAFFVIEAVNGAGIDVKGNIWVTGTKGGAFFRAKRGVQFPDMAFHRAACFFIDVAIDLPAIIRDGASEITAGRGEPGK